MERLVTFLLAIVMSACSAAPPAPTWPGNELAGGNARGYVYRVHCGDMIGIRFPAYPQWNASILVQPDGAASVPLLGSIAFQGRTLADLEQEVFELLSQRVRSPKVEIVVDQLHTRAIFVGGEIGNPGVYQLPGPRASMLEAIFARGGPLEKTAALDNVILSRIVDGARRSWTIDAFAAMSGTADPVYLLEGDVLLVPGTAIVQADRFVDQYITGLIPGSNLLAGWILAGN